jgi:hypothetical protein
MCDFAKGFDIIKYDLLDAFCGCLKRRVNENDTPQQLINENEVDNHICFGLCFHLIMVIFAFLLFIIYVSIILVAAPLLCIKYLIYVLIYEQKEYIDAFWAALLLCLPGYGIAIMLISFNYSK